VYDSQWRQTTDTVNSVMSLDVLLRQMLFEVLEGYFTYFLTDLWVSTQITNLDPTYRVLVKGTFISPYSVGVLYNLA